MDFVQNWDPQYSLCPQQTPVHLNIGFIAALKTRLQNKRKRRPSNVQEIATQVILSAHLLRQEPFSNLEALNNVLEKKILLVQLCELHLKQLYKWDPCKSVQGPIKVQELAKLEKQRKKSIQVSNSDLYFYFNETLEK